jgi:hypothetical protein
MRLHSKSLIRSLNRRGTKSDKTPPVALKAPASKDPSICYRCGAVYTNKTWRRGRKPEPGLMDRGEWTLCPACKQVEGGDEYYGRVLISGRYVAAHLDAIRGRIKNVEARAEFTQPEHQLVGSEWNGSTLEVLTTSQKLAHRIARELEKAFGGKVKYAWSDIDGTLNATWKRDSESLRNA